MPGIRLVLVLATIVKYVYSQTYQHQVPNRLQTTISIGPCRIVMNPQCPDPDVTFFMYSTDHPESPEPIYMDTHLRGTNLNQTSFDPTKPSKVIIHGYNSNMFLSALTELRREYVRSNDYNIFVVDWSPLNQAPCYPAAVWNARHVGTCLAQLVLRIRDMGADDIHVIGFSLGAHIANYLSIALRPYKLPRITGLDPALPGFLTSNNEEKLDRSDAEFVDVYHTSAFAQGKAEESGHVDFYFNGGAIQPGCWGTENFFSCNHHRAPLYFAESINTTTGFWGWKCAGYFEYLAGRCPPNSVQIILGENMSQDAFGTYMVVTASTPPFALGPYNNTVGGTRLKFPDILNNHIHQMPVPEVPLVNRYHQEYVHPSTVEEHELFNEVLEENLFNDIGIQNQAFGGDFGVFQGREGKILGFDQNIQSLN